MTALKSALSQLPFFRGPNGADRLRDSRRVVAESHDRAQRWRARVLTDPQASAELCRALGLRRADQWTGYVPPYLDSRGRINDTPQRAALVRVLAGITARRNGSDP